MTRRLLFGLVLLIVPFVAVVAGIVAAVRWLFISENTVTESTLRRIRAESERADRLRELLETRVVLRPSVMDGPAPMSVYDREVPR